MAVAGEIYMAAVSGCVRWRIGCCRETSRCGGIGCDHLVAGTAICDSESLKAEEALCVAPPLPAARTNVEIWKENYRV
jgi:hypothetical protein